MRTEFRLRRIIMPEMEIAGKIGIPLVERLASVLLTERTVLVVDGDDLDCVSAATVENERPHVVRPDLTAPDIFRIRLFPFRGIRAVHRRRRDARLGPRPVRRIRNAGTGFDSAAEQTAAFEKDESTRLKRLAVEPLDRPPGSLRRQTVRRVVARRRKITSRRSFRHGHIRGIANRLYPPGEEIINASQRFIGDFDETTARATDRTGKRCPDGIHVQNGGQHQNRIEDK